MKIDEVVFDAAAMGYGAFPGTVERLRLKAFLDCYLAALPAEPEIEGGVRVRALCGVMVENRFEIVGWNDFDQYDESEEKSRIVGERGDAQWCWVEATVPPYTPPAEPVVEGRLVEANDG